MPPGCRWKVLTAAAPGWKRPDGQRGDDRLRTATLPLWNGEALLAVCADGAGSALHGGVGAELACKTALRHLKRLMVRRARRRGLPTEAELRAVNEAVREALDHEAARRRVLVRELSTTLLILIATTVGTVCSQIGDGALVVRLDGDLEYRHVFWPDQGEFANSTHFATERPQRLHIAHLPRVQAVALLTDGLQGIALDYAAHRAHPPFFAGLFAELARAEVTALEAPLLRLITSPAVRERTDDDVTLVLALCIDAPASTQIDREGGHAAA
jgi:hypothetical protein